MMLATCSRRGLHKSPICNNSVTSQNVWFFQERLLKGLKCYNFLWVQRRYNCPQAAIFANCVMTLHLLKAYLQTFLSMPITQKCQVAKWAKWTICIYLCVWVFFYWGVTELGATAINLLKFKLYSVKNNWTNEGAKVLELLMTVTFFKLCFLLFIQTVVLLLSYTLPQFHAPVFILHFIV
jgi:hypothetical protein